MIVNFEKEYLRELYETGKAKDKKHRFQPHIVTAYIKTVKAMIMRNNVLELSRYPALHYEKLHGDKEGISSVRVNKQYRIEFREILEEGKIIAEICNITELSNHYE